jgi:hypothetical protein
VFSPRSATVSQPAQLFIWPRGAGLGARVIASSLYVLGQQNEISLSRNVFYMAHHLSGPCCCGVLPTQRLRLHVRSQAVTRQDDWPETCQKGHTGATTLTTCLVLDLLQILPLFMIRGLFLRARFHVGIFYSSSMRISNSERQSSLVLSTALASKSMT